jgi:uncharacterized protein
MSFNPDSVLPLIVCPRSHAPLVHERNSLVSTDPQTRLKYEVRDGIPVLLIDEAEEMPQDEWAALMHKHGRDPQTGQLVEAPGNALEGFP